MTSYNYNHYNQAFDQPNNDRNSQMYWDAVSMTSSDRNSIALSVYHSVPENLQHDEQSGSGRQNNKNDWVSYRLLNGNLFLMLTFYPRLFTDLARQ